MKIPRIIHPLDTQPIRKPPLLKKPKELHSELMLSLKCLQSLSGHPKGTIQFGIFPVNSVDYGLNDRLQDPKASELHLHQTTTHRTCHQVTSDPVSGCSIVMAITSLPKTAPEAPRFCAAEFSSINLSSKLRTDIRAKSENSKHRPSTCLWINALIFFPEIVTIHNWPILKIKWETLRVEA